MDKSILRAMSLAAACAMCHGSARADSFSFDDVHFWVGSGTNRAVVVVDFNIPDKPESSLAWGYRWNGNAVQKDALDAIAREDRRYRLLQSVSSYGPSLDGMAYDANGNGGVFAIADGYAYDDDDLVGVNGLGDNYAYYFWGSLMLTNSLTYNITDWKDCGSGFGSQELLPNTFAGFTFSSDWPPPIPSFPVAAESPYAYKVVETETAVGSSVNNNIYSVLGRPTLHDEISDDNFAISPVTPFLPAWTEENVLSLVRYYDTGTLSYKPGTVVVEFDHRVMDDPMNPWGIDFIVFGNTMLDVGEVTGREDPATVRTDSSSEFEAEPGMVSVSQDGQTWYTFEEGPFADDFAPTLGYRYDPANADATLFEGNQWWGAPTDPTYPVDPSLVPEAGVIDGEPAMFPPARLRNKTLAEIAKYYNGSAGGTGFDINKLDLPPDENGRKWFKFVRVTTHDPNNKRYSCEIDAFADVYPDLPYDYWAKQYYTWEELADSAVSGKAVECENGKPNFYNAAMNVAPTDEAPPLKVSDITVDGDDIRISFEVSEYGYDVKPILKPKTSLSSLTWGEAPPATRFEGFVPNSKGGLTGTIYTSFSGMSLDSVFFKIGIGTHDE